MLFITPQNGDPSQDALELGSVIKHCRFYRASPYSTPVHSTLRSKGFHSLRLFSWAFACLTRLAPPPFLLCLRLVRNATKALKTST